METQLCIGRCKTEKPVQKFRRNTPDGNWRKICIACEDKRWRDSSPRYLERARQRRLENIPQTIWTDSRKSDKKYGRPNDLTKEFIRNLIADGCGYCGERGLRMTMDRIDNSLGHTQDNVKPACVRCNYMRRDMPFEAWLTLLPGVRRAREEGLFRSWIGCNARGYGVISVAAQA